jgi:hypothetical protein
MTILLLPLLTIVINIVMVLQDHHHQQQQQGGANGGGGEEDYGISHSVQGWVLAWHLLFILVLYMVVLPKQIDVRSNGTVGIKTFLMTFHIDDIVHAYDLGTGVVRSTTWTCRNQSYVTQFGDGGRVVLRRRHGKGDVSVTPIDPMGFICAIEEVVRGDGSTTVIEDNDIGIVVPSSSSSSSFMNGGRGTKPDLASAVHV